LVVAFFAVAFFVAVFLGGMPLVPPPHLVLAIATA